MSPSTDSASTALSVLVSPNGHQNRQARLTELLLTQISFNGVGMDFGASTIFSDISFTVAAGERWGVVGRNGTGKTTLFRLLTGELEPSRGTVVRQPGLRVSLLEQHRAFEGAETVWEAAAGELGELLALEQSLMDQAAALATDSSEAAMSRYGKDLERFEREGGYEVTSRIDAVLHGIGFDPATARVTPVSTLSGGERGRLGLARQLVSTADILLLDEPTNHLDLETTRWLEQYLKEMGRTVLLVSHDRAFLAATVDHVLHFEGGSATAYAAGYHGFVAQREERRVAQQRQFHQQQQKIARETDYIARNLAGQNTRQAKGRRKLLARMPRLSPPVEDEDRMALRFATRERGGDRVVSASRVSVSVGGRMLVENFTGAVMRGDVLGFIGPNGSGKSTFIRTLLGENPLAAGELRIGGTVTAAHYRQDLSQLPSEDSVYSSISALRPGWERRLVQGHLGRFGFSGDEVQRRIGSLSGGEQARVALAMLMLSGANLLILDEPTNHLDVESIEALEDAIERYDGTVLLVSHDRELLRVLTSKVWVLHDKHITEFPGGFAEWEEVSAEREHAASVKAAEEQALNRVHERQKVASANRSARSERGSGSARTSLRAARRDLEESEAAVNDLERRVAEVTSLLEDPELYTRAEGQGEARRLGAELDVLTTELEGALQRWTDAGSKLSAMGESFG